ncbi:hypothetical protein [uncultured Bartonella sp.]|uniref:hypothetical protein n=1 Tax=uncultured Bartonella sp. TaxID=104108 RepID=UPI0025CF2D7C|nr:hypothetical protein [uncultured Bartonella sp.]
MANAEQAIRNALLKIDSSNVAQRRRVYESAWNAHERALLSSHGLNDVTRTKRRDALMQIIRAIESDYVATETNKADEETHDLASEGPEDQIKIEVNGATNLEDTTLHRASARRRSKILLIVAPSILAIIMIIGFTGWSFFNSLSGRAIIEHRKEAIEQNQRTKTVVPFRKEADNDGSWIKFFYPGDATAITTYGQASVSIKDDGGIPYAHITANSDEDVVVVEIGAGALSNLRGKKAMIDINARGDGTKPSQMSITCDLGNNADCGRRRFEVPVNRNDLLFEVTIPAEDNSPAKIYLTSDLLGEGNGIDIYGMKIKAAD